LKCATAVTGCTRYYGQ